MKKKFTFKFMLLLFALVVGIGNAWAKDETIEITYSNFTNTSYNASENTFNQDDISFGYINAMRNGSNGTPSGWAKDQVIQTKNTGFIYNKGAITGLKNIRVYTVANTNTFTVTSGEASRPNTNSVIRPDTPTGTESITYTQYKDKVTTPNQTTTANYYDFAVSDDYFQIAPGGSLYIWKIVLTFEEGLSDNDLALTDALVSLSFDLYDNSDSQVVSYTTSSTGVVYVDANAYISAEVDQVNQRITVTPVKKTPSAQTITVRQAADDTYKAGSVTFTVNITDSTPVSWVETSLANLTSGDVFVIVGNNGSNYAMTNDNGTSDPPAASAVTIEKVNNINKINSDVSDNIQWNLVITDGGYVFYPVGDASKWLYCTNTNNGVRVGTNNNNIFVLDGESGYLKNVATSRYVGIYNSQDWRCYTNTDGNIANQTFAFYKKVYDNASSYSTSITGCDDSGKAGYYLIASPVAAVTPTAINGFLANQYDLYSFDQSYERAEWRNYKQNHFSNIVSGKGYLYANSGDVTLTFAGQPYNGNGIVTLDYTEGVAFSGWNLIGNPYSVTASLSGDRLFYRMNTAGSDIVVRGGDEKAINPMEGIFVQAANSTDAVTFIPTAPAKASNSSIALNIIGNNDNVIDRAIVNFDGNTLEKLMIDENNTKIYIPQNNTRYAVACGDAKGSMPVNFKAAETGKYNISVNTDGLDMDYLHLIDRLTGEDINLLLEDSYSFIASKQDPESRFILSFTANGYNNDADATFAYQNGSEIIVNGEGELQIFDVTGRKVMTTTINGVETINGLNSGVYIFRVIGDTLRTQKIVVR